MTDDKKTTDLRWAKDRALEYARRGDMQNAFASLASDFNKIGRENDPIIQMGMMLLMMGHLNTVDKMVDWIEGFN